jgi:hypothetical protein
VWFAGGFAGLCVLGTVAVCGGLIAMTGGAEGGVRYPNNMEQYALDYIEQHGVLLPGERIVAYYDVTLTLDATESAMLTDRRLVYHRAGNTTAIALADIVDVYVSDEPLIGDVLDVSARDGSLMHIEIAPLNGGAGFIRALENQRSSAGGSLGGGALDRPVGAPGQAGGGF